MKTLLFLLLLPGQADGHERYPEPEKCQAVLEDFGNVGYRIADAQALAERALIPLKKRLGRDAVIYEGLLKQAKKMKRMLGRRADTSLQEGQITYLKAAAKNAEWRVRVRFGKRKGRHWVKVTCRKAGDPPRKVVEKKRLTARRFDDLKAEFAEEMKTFCSRMDPPPPEPKLPKRKKRPDKEWQLPPMRR